MVVIILLNTTSHQVAVAGQELELDNGMDSWRDCDSFMAPSSIPGGGWGVFAGRDFEMGDIVEVTPLNIPLPPETPVIRNSALDDYNYGYLRWDDVHREMVYLADAVLGSAMMYNHHAQHNIKWSSFGREPTSQEPSIGQATGFVALRYIEAGEELFSTYDEETRGKKWFSDRGLDMIEVPASRSRKRGPVYHADKQKYCSKLYAGYGQPGWKDKIMASIFKTAVFPFKLNPQRLAPKDHPTAVVKHSVVAGTTLEMAPAVVISKDKVVKTPLAPISFFWQDLDSIQQTALMELRKSGDLFVQHQDDHTRWVRQDFFEQFEDVVLFPASGSIALVERVDKEEDSNCMLKIVASGSMKTHDTSSHGGAVGSAGLMLELVATSDLKVGDGLKLHIPVSASPFEHHLLVEELDRTGQLVPEYLRKRADQSDTTVADDIDSWQNCDIFLAPSSLPGGGWGVFAGRAFEPNEIVEIAPRHIPLPPTLSAVQNSVLDDYIYGYLRWDENQQANVYRSNVVLGAVMFYNHHAENNLMWTSFGKEPTRRDPTFGRATGFIAKRKIEAGEELFSTYDTETGGEKWFADRGLKLIQIPITASRKTGVVYEEDKKKYCSKVYAGFGQLSWREMIMASYTDPSDFDYFFNSHRLSSADHPTAVVKQDASAGTVLEMSPVLAVSKDKIENTALAPMSFFWHDLDPDQQRTLMQLRESGDLRVQHQGPETNWVREDHFTGFENIVLFPAAGNLALVGRVDKKEDANCIVKIVASGSMKSHVSHGGGNGSAGVVFQLVATRDLKIGDTLQLHALNSATEDESRMLVEELKNTGQPIPGYLQEYVGPRKRNDEL